MLTVMSESLRSKVIELECMHHRCMQLREVAELLNDELQLAANDGKTQARLGNAGRERVIRDFKVLFIEQEKLHREIENFAAAITLLWNWENSPPDFPPMDL